MTFRGFFELNGVEIANSSRVAAHIGATAPLSDVGVLTDPVWPDWVEDPPGSGLYVPQGAETDPELYTVPDTTTSDLDGLYPPAGGPCELTETSDGSGLYLIPATSAPVAAGLYSPPDGARLYDAGLYMVGDCWDDSTLCGGCRQHVAYDDTWPGLPDLLGDTLYRPELAPWYSTRVPESAEFGGVWVLDVKGLDTTPVERSVTQLAGSGAAAGPYRDAARTVTFEAVMVACSNAGLTHGMQWLACQLRDTNTRTDSVLRYLAAHPSHSAVDPTTLVREVHGVVLTSGPTISEALAGGGRRNQQATMYRITWEMAVLHPYAYTPAVDVAVEWKSITTEPIEWVHAADCVEPETCDPMPVLFSTECEVERIEVVTSPPPSCGGCMPVCAVETHVFEVPTFTYPTRCRETAVSMTVTNTGAHPLTVNGFWRICGSDVRCDNDLWPIQITGLPPNSALVLDAVSGRYWAEYDNRRRRPVGILSTPTGAPWRPPIIDRGNCWEFVVVAPGDADFTVAMTLRDREA